MKTEGIRKVFAEQGAEGAIYALAHALEAVGAQIDNLKISSPPPVAEEKKEEGN